MLNSELAQLDLMLQDCYTADLCWEKMRPKWSSDNASWGMCAIVALLVNELFDGEIRKTKVGEYSHFFNFIDGNIVDLTGRQFNTRIDYKNSVACKRDEILNENTSKRYIKLKERLASSQTQQKGLMTTITYQLRDRSGSITWAAAEEFDELRGKEFSLGKMEAKQIDQIEDLSFVAKLLLSAVAGALIQHLMDEGVPPREIFASGTFKAQ